MVVFNEWPMGLPRALRLTHADDFARVRREGRVFRHRLLLMSVAPNPVGYNRYGLVTGKKIGKAHQRNRVRRVLRAVLRLRHATLRTGFDVVLVAHPSSVDATWLEMRAAVDTLLNQAGLLVIE